MGCSGYRIDLGVVHPDLPGAYLVGIECDGAQYHSSCNARDRDKLRQSVLEGLGWIIVRVWSTEWWRDRDGQVERLVERIEQGRRTYDERQAARQECVAESSKPEEPVTAAAGENPISGNAGALWVPPAAPPKPPAANVYRAHRFAEAEGAPERFFDASETLAIRRAVESVIESEAPVSEALLTARVRGQWGLKSSGSRIAERVRSVASSLEIPTVKHGDTVFYWPRGADPRKWSDFRIAGEDPLDQRNAEDLPPEEIAAAAHAVLKSHVSLTQEGLVTETARLFGYKRTGRKLQEAIAAGVALLLERGVAQEER
ncbi:MAG TPA: DUF3320 domain-containing protein [Bacteroidia bacterium]|nr:DUF3320 domain-containing protein [Bacteroidia bacterium]